MTKEQLRAWRGQMSQSAAADLLGIPLPSYRNYETGHRNVPTVLASLIRYMKANPPKTRAMA